ELGTRLRQVADLVAAGNAGAAVAATETVVAVGTWRLAGQLSDAATVTAVTLLGRVSGVSGVTSPTQPATTAARTVPTTVAPGKAKDKGKGN
ncbi:MAG: hypothetical protein M3Y04_05985, partial [Actinomycetota bacterium]|nr:hypothetical protein [Actinomycetota bacterium]